MDCETEARTGVAKAVEGILYGPDYFVIYLGV